jgi:hypothetical protein
MRFDFSQGLGKGEGEYPLVLLDLTDLWQSRQNGSIVVDGGTGRMMGNGTFLPGFGAGSYDMHFCVDIMTLGSPPRIGVTYSRKSETSELGSLSSPSKAS